VNGVGEPCAGEPHALFEAAGAGNGAPGHGHRSEAARRGNPGKSGCGTSRRTTPPRQPPTLPGTTRVPASDYAGSRPSLDARFGHVIRYICCGGAVTGKILPLRERSTSTIQAAAVAFCPRRG